MSHQFPTANVILERASETASNAKGSAGEPIGVDLAAVATALSRRLYAAGLPVTPEHTVRFSEALILVSPASRSELYHAARAVFVSAPVHLPAFDRVFAHIFDGCPGNGSNDAGTTGDRVTVRSDV